MTDLLETEVIPLYVFSSLRAVVLLSLFSKRASGRGERSPNRRLKKKKRRSRAANERNFCKNQIGIELRLIAKMPFYGSIVVIRRTGLDGSIFPLVSSECLLGRSEHCDIRVQLPTVSGEHCKITINNSDQVRLT